MAYVFMMIALSVFMEILTTFFKVGIIAVSATCDGHKATLTGWFDFGQ